MPAGFHRLIAAQFCSALADNALLILCVALLQARGQPGWWAPLLKLCTTAAYVALAPFVGALADAVPKARLMAWMNAVKTLALIGLLAGLEPLACFALLGCGAAAYAPAKYGLVTELVPPDQLVRANAWIEVSVVGAVLLGTVLGGLLLSETFALPARAWMGPAAIGGTPGSLWLALCALLGVYALASGLNIGLPDSGARYPASGRAPWPLLQSFWRANRRLWADRRGGLSLAITTLFWGVGACLQFAVLRWAQQVLGMGLSQASMMQAMVAVGVVLGAGLAGRYVPLARAHLVLPVGALLGALIALSALTDSRTVALPLLACLGAVGGWLVVPMNALLQHRGQALLSAGQSIAVQNFNENLSMLLMLAAYASLLAMDVPIVGLMLLLGGAVALFVLALMAREALATRRDASGPGRLRRPA